MDNRPLALCLDADARPFVRDMTLEEAARRTAMVIWSGDHIDTVAAGVYNGHILTCQQQSGGYFCWFSLHGWTIGYRAGATPAQAIERAQAACA